VNVSTKFGKFELIAVQGHRSWCQSKAQIWLPISH